MKIAVPYENGMVFQHFGHTEQFKVYDVENGEITGSSVADASGSGHGALARVSPRSWLFLILSGLATGASWLCYYRALQLGEVSKVVPVDKLSVVITLVLAFVLLHEQFTLKSLAGCVLLAAGTLLLVM